MLTDCELALITLLDGSDYRDIVRMNGISEYEAKHIFNIRDNILIKQKYESEFIQFLDLIDEDRLEEANILLSKLTSILGENDSNIIKLKNFIN